MVIHSAKSTDAQLGVAAEERLAAVLGGLVWEPPWWV